MRYSLTDLPALARTPIGRARLVEGIRYHTFPYWAWRAGRYRKSLKNTCFVTVVGSFGKTTTMRFAHAALGMPPELEPRGNALALLADHVTNTSREAPYRVLEVGIARPGEMERYARMIQPDIVVATSVGSEHRRSLKTVETTRHEKAMMLRALKPDGVAVINADDENVRWMAEQTKAKVVTFGFGKDCEIRAENVEHLGPEGVRFRLHAGEEQRTVHLKMLGNPMIYSALGAVGAALAAGRDLDVIIKCIERLEATPSRLAPMRLPQGAWIIDDAFKSALETVHSALDTFERFEAQRKFIVMGEVSEPPGSQGPIYRDIGRRLGEIGDRIWVLGGNFQRYTAGARAAGIDTEKFIDGGRDFSTVADELAGILQEGDLLLLKGRDTQRLDRVRLMLFGEKVKCTIPRCNARLLCQFCSMRERGWGDERVIM